MKTLFLGGSFSVNIYAQKNGIALPIIIHNASQLFAYHNSLPLYVMEDAEQIYGPDLLRIISAATDKNYDVVYLTYAESFPLDQKPTGDTE